LLAISIGSILIGYALKFLTPRETGPSQVEKAAPLPTQQAAPAPPAAPTPPKEADSTAVKGADLAPKFYPIVSSLLAFGLPCWAV
jgi:hypothetical protein